MKSHHNLGQPKINSQVHVPWSGKVQDYSNRSELFNKYSIAIESISLVPESTSDEIKEMYSFAVEDILRSDRVMEIIAMPRLISKAFDLEVEKSVLNNLEIASLNGWIAYSIYDDLVDGDAEIKKLGTANIAQRIMLRCFTSAVQNEEYDKLVDAALASMDSVNTSEVDVRKSQAEIELNEVTLNKSRGYALPALGVMLSAGYSIKDTKVTELQNFFDNVCCIRQLSDDVLDYEHDLLKGRVTPVTSRIMDSKSDNTSVSVSVGVGVIDEINNRIRSHVDQAVNALSRMQCKDPSFLESLLDPFKSI